MMKLRVQHVQADYLEELHFPTSQHVASHIMTLPVYYDDVAGAGLGSTSCKISRLAQRVFFENRVA